ncbi:hypothetical protein C7H84_30230 [Burkholderia sp. Nafp2/4-1b]|uniref:hypothetical protein n=1 Tax=Burkholderia sp. Nafp2/4-1b TaxID=2116686 RepID=UPI000EF95F63|nr:hypothetical protein [Burkholderia sp. Nafp2/4-1b]RKT99556.1 hypothetical protein C7H84_30230 [Burkholderia sp. Nafp2/4-1b]
MAKITDAPISPVPDARAESTADQSPAALDPLDAIRQEEQDENESIRLKTEQAEQDAEEAEMAALVEGWREAMRAAADLVTSAVPGLKPVWSAERMDNIGAALARCDAKYGWGGAGEVFKSPLVALGIASFPVAIGTVQYAKVAKAQAQAAALAARRAQAHLEGAPLPPGQPSAPSETPAPVAPRTTGRVPNLAPDMSAALDRATYAQ